MVASPRPGNREQNPKSWGRSWAPDLVGINSVRPLPEQVPGFSASTFSLPLRTANRPLCRSFRAPLCEGPQRLILKMTTAIVVFVSLTRIP